MTKTWQRLGVLPVVAVEVAQASPAQGQNLAALLDACTQALPSGTCEPSLSEALAQAAAARARITWNDLGDVSIVVELSGSPRQLVRELVFAAQDPELQRWRTAGLTIATMVDELREEREAKAAEAQPSDAAAEEPPPPSVEPQKEPVPAPAPAPAPAPTPPPITKPAPRSPPRSDHPRRDQSAPIDHQSMNAIETGALFGIGVNGATPRGGLYASGAHDMAGLPAFAAVQASFQLSSASSPSLSWLEIGLGGGARFPLLGARGEIRGLLQMARVEASARSPATGASDDAATWLPAAELEMRVLWPARASVSFVLALRGQWMAREIAVTNAGAEVARVAPYSVGLVGGVRFAL